MVSPSVELLSVCVPSAIFFRNNVEKVKNGEKARGSVVFAQGAKIAQAVAKYHNSTAQTASEAYNIFGKYAKDCKALEVAGKGIDWASKHVNPLICASAVYKTVTADDKVETGISQTGAIAGMFAGEGLMKQVQDRIFSESNVKKVLESVKEVPGLKSVANYVLKSGNSGRLGAIMKGLAFVTVSMTSYNIGEKLAEPIAQQVSSSLAVLDNDKGNNKDNQQNQNAKIDRLA